MNQDELNARYIKFCNTLDSLSDGDTDSYLSRSALDKNLALDVMRHAFMYIGSTLKSQDFASNKNIEVIATRIENYYLSRKDDILNMLHNMVVNDHENFIERTCRSSEQYMKYMNEAREKKHGNTSGIAKKIHKRREISLSSGVVLPASLSSPFNETIDSEHIGVFLAAQHLKLQQMGLSDNLNLLEHIGLFAVNGGILSYQERIQHMWMAYNNLDGQENVLWKAYKANNNFAKLPQKKRVAQDDKDYALISLQEYIAEFTETHLEVLRMRTKILSEKKDDPTFFDSKDDYLKIYCNALVLEAVYSAYIANLDISPVVIVSGPALKNPKGS